MGVSLQIYRVRIGTFNPSVRVKTTMEQPGTFITQFKWNYYLTTCFALLCLLTTFVFLSQEDLLLWTSIATEPSTTACNSSRGPLCTPGLYWTLSTALPWTFQSFVPPKYPSSSYQPQANITHKPFKFFQVQPPSSWTNSACTPVSTRPQKHLHLNPAYLHLRQPPSWLSARTRNSLVKAMNGNRANKGRGIKMIAWNKGSSHLQNKHLEVETIIAANKPHILGLSEANLKREIDPSQVQHADYTLHTAPTLDNPQLGIARMVVYTHSSLVVKRRHDLENDFLSAVWLELGMPRQKKIVVCNIYREWQHMGQGPTNTTGTIAEQLQRWMLFIESWDRALQEGKEVMVLGDINLDFLKWNRSNLPASDSSVRLKQLSELVFDRIFPQGVSQLVTTPTRLSAVDPPSGLDHIYTNRPDKCSEVQAEVHGGSDHKLLKVTRFSKAEVRSARYVRKRCYKNFCPVQFCEAVKELSWFELYMCDSPSTAADILTKKLSNILDKLAPIRTIQVHTKYAPWLPSTTKELIKKRNEAHEKAAQSKDPDDWRAYKNLRNTTTAMLRSEKKDWTRQKLDGASHNPETIWRNVKSWLSWGNSGPPSKLFIGGEMVSSPYRVSGAMNNYFINKVRLRNERIPESEEDPLQKLRESMRSRQCSFSLHSVSPGNVAEIIAGLKNSKSTGVDFIDTWVIKLVANDILPAITHIINLSIAHSEFPSSWKLSKVVPLLKKGDPLVPSNYRPVALLPIFSKILEKVVFLQLVKYLDSNGLLHPNHHGSRIGHNTATALLQM